VESEETSTARKRLGKQVPAATNTQATTEEILETVFSVGFAPRIYNEGPRPSGEIIEKRWERDSCQLKQRT
jgi:hypothetical protein